MSPATYDGGKTPCSPHSQMQTLDEKGDAYWLENIQLSTGVSIERADVVAHSPEWLVLHETDRVGRAHDTTERTWTVQTAHIVRFRIVEG